MKFVRDFEISDEYIMVIIEVSFGYYYIYYIDFDVMFGLILYGYGIIEKMFYGYLGEILIVIVMYLLFVSEFLTDFIVF